MVQRFLLVAILVSLGSVGAEAQVHRSPMAGRWFPSDSAELRKSLEKAVQAADQRAAGAPGRTDLLALIVPHAGIQYSGIVGASAYRTLGKSKNIIVLGFSHSHAVDGIVAPAITAFETPLGQVQVNREVLRELGFRMVPEGEVCDHSLENQLPFLQFIAPQALLVPLYVGELTAEERTAAARKIAGRIQKGDLVIASSDFTHYGKEYGYVPFANDAKVAERLSSQAKEAFEEIGSTEVKAFDAYLQRTGDTICGRDPIRLLMETLAQLDRNVYPELVDYMTSGEITRDYSASVGYAALAFYPPSSFEVSEADQRKLLTSARATLERYYAGARQQVTMQPSERSAAVLQRSGAFVTIRKDGELRGCIGILSTRKALWETIPDRTLAASTSDPRFRPVTMREGAVNLEISILTPLKKIDTWERFQLGKGAVLLTGDSGATLLPQVAQEMGWTRQQFLENLAQKAGLSPTGYRDRDARLYVFEAQVFAEPAAPPVNGHQRRQ